MTLVSNQPSRSRRLGWRLCGAKTRAGGCCQVRAEPGKARCRFHDGKSTGPKTPAGRARIAEAQRLRRRAYREGDDAAEQSVQEQHTPPASTETSASTATSSQADAVIRAARKVELAGGPHNVRMPNTGQQRATPPTLQSGSQSGSNGEIDLQTLIAISLTVATGLVVVGMLARAGLLDRAARRKLIATETPDPYDDPEFYRKLREGNFA